MRHELIRHEVLEELEAVDHVCKHCNSHFYSCCGEDLSLENHSCVEVFSLDSGFENHRPRVEATKSWYSAVVRYFKGRMSGFHYQAQCAPGIFNLDKKFHGLSCFWSFHRCKRVQNQ